MKRLVVTTLVMVLMFVAGNAIAKKRVKEDTSTASQTSGRIGYVDLNRALNEVEERS